MTVTHCTHLCSHDTSASDLPNSLHSSAEYHGLQRTERSKSRQTARTQSQQHHHPTICNSTTCTSAFLNSSVTLKQGPTKHQTEANATRRDRVRSTVRHGSSQDAPFCLRGRRLQKESMRKLGHRHGRVVEALPATVHPTPRV